MIYTAEKMGNRGHKSKLSDETKERIHWDPCLKKAENYCIKCQNFLCEDCLGRHNSEPNQSGHVVFPMDDNGVITRPCRFHPEENIKYFFKPFDEVGCETCRTFVDK